MNNLQLHLDKGFRPSAGQEILFDQLQFSGGEPHIKIHPDFDRHIPVTVTHRINSFNDLGLLCLAVDALKRMKATIYELIIPYFPAARQDRVMIPGEPLSVKVYAGIVNQLGFQKVTILDAHSDVTPALVENCEAISNHAFIKEVLKQVAVESLVSPDGGALKKIYKLSEYLGGMEVIECSKSRDVKNGRLTGFRVYADDLAGKDLLVVDDICDGGATFTGLARELKKKNAGKLYLAVTHGIFSKGLEELGKDFERIFTTDSIREISHPSLTQIKLNHGLLS